MYFKAGRLLVRIYKTNNKKPYKSMIYRVYMVGPAGLEPATKGL